MKKTNYSLLRYAVSGFSLMASSLFLCNNAMAAEQDANSGVSQAPLIQVKPDPDKGSPFNHGVFEGWGTSLCWWGNRVGNDNKLSDECVNAFFRKDSGLMLNIVRYNIGGGDDPTHNHIRRSDSNMPGFAQPVLDKDGNFEVDGSGLVMYDYDWNKDANQINVMKKIHAANPDVLVEAFSNSPPYFMTYSGCSSGGRGEHEDNLNSAYNEMFADFLADVVVHFHRELHIKLNSVSPMNEPSSRYWKYFSNKQEGCDFRDMKKQNDLIVALDKSLKKKGVRNEVLIAASDETSIDLVERAYNGLQPEGKKALDRVNTHTYGGSRRKQAADFVKQTGKHFWMSEVDGTGTIGGNAAGDMSAPLWLAKRITDDVNGLQVSAWVLWQVVASYYDPNNEFDRRRPTLKNGYWGVSYSDHEKSSLVLGKKYYAFGQYTRYIRPGDHVIASSAKTLCAYHPETGKIVLAVYNDLNQEQPYSVDLSNFKKIPAKEARVFATSGNLNEGENLTENPKVKLDGNLLKFTVKPFSVTTFVIADSKTVLPK